MKRNLLLTIFIFCLCQIGLAQSLKKIGTLERKNDSIFVVENGKYYIVNKNVVTVKLKSGIDGFEKAAQKIRSNRLGYIDLVVPEGIDLEKYVSVLEYTGKFDIVEYNNIGQYCVITNDTERSNQWYLNNINAFNAWDITMGSSNTTVAILDSGTDWRHPDIGNGSDGYKNINEQAGWNYISNTNNVITSNGHGTRVTGIVGAKSNNYIGISGISGGNNSVGITMIPFCVGIDAPDGSIIDDAIIDATDSGAKVIQLSLNVAQTNAINAAIDYAVQNNVVIVCASGNNYSSMVSYPASHQNVIAVGATNKSNVRANFSNYGTSLDVVVPGVDIFSTTLNDGYNSQDGTSFAAPQVSGVAALILSVRPDLTGQQVRDVIEQTTQKIGGYSYVTTSGRSNGTWNQEMGYGLVDAYDAVYAIAPRISGPTTICNQDTFTIINPPSGATITWSASNNNLTLVSGQGTSSAVFSKNSNGLSQVNAAISTGGTTINLSFNDIVVGIPPVQRFKVIDTSIYPYIPEYVLPDRIKAFLPYTIVSLTPEHESSNTSLEYSVQTSGNFSYTKSTDPSDPWITFNVPPSPTLFWIDYRYRNACGWSPWYRFNGFSKGSRELFALYPNPATDQLTINLREAVQSTDQSEEHTDFSQSTDSEKITYPYTIQLWHERNGMVREIKSTERVTHISLLGLSKGMYFVHLQKDGKLIQKKLLWVK